jgi:hypothetical protein
MTGMGDEPWTAPHFPVLVGAPAEYPDGCSPSPWAGVPGKAGSAALSATIKFQRSASSAEVRASTDGGDD